MIKLPYELGLTVRESITDNRRRNNIPEPQELSNIYNPNDTFFEEEFTLVTSISISLDTLPYIHYFPNLNSITFDSINDVNQIELQKIINDYPNLEKLEIIGQNEIQVLDLRSLVKLKELKIVSNNSLNRIRGLDKLENINKFTFYDNRSYKFIDNICQHAIRFAEKESQCGIDVLYYPEIVKLMSQNDNYKRSPSMINNHIKWYEAVGLGFYTDHLQYNMSDMQLAYNNALSIIRDYIKEQDTTVQKYAILYQWMCENVKYDHDALNNNYIHSENGLNVGIKGGTNGIVNGLVYGSCVCQGYSKVMQFLLKLCGIYAFDVGCRVNENYMNVIPISLNGKRAMARGNHSILKININGKISYSDVTADTSRYQSNRERIYFLLSKDDISKSHELIGESMVVSELTHSYKKEEQDWLLEFAKRRIEIVNLEKNLINIQDQDEPISEKNFKTR